MAKNYQNKTVRATSEGLIISYVSGFQKNQFIRYNETFEKEETPIQEYQLNTFLLNAKQKQLYNEVLYGFSSFTKEELKTMPEQRKLSVMINYTKAKRILRNHKQDVLYPTVDEFLSAWFPKSSLVKDITSCTTKEGHLPLTDEEDNITFEELGISQKTIVEKLIKYKILPKNFYQLT